MHHTCILFAGTMLTSFCYSQKSPNRILTIIYIFTVHKAAIVSHRLQKSHWLIKTCEINSCTNPNKHEQGYICVSTMYPYMYNYLEQGLKVYPRTLVYSWDNVWSNDAVIVSNWFTNHHVQCWHIIITKWTCLYSYT